MAHESTSGDLSSLNYTILVPYNGTIATGGDSLTDNLNIFYEVSHFAGNERKANADVDIHSRATLHGS